MPGAQLVEGLEQVRPHFFCGHLRCWASGGEKEAHTVLILLSAWQGFWWVEFDKKNLRTASANFFAVLRVFLKGFWKNVLYFGGNLLVKSWWNAWFLWTDDMA